MIGMILKIVAYVAGKDKAWATRLNKVGNIILSVEVGLIVFCVLLTLFGASVGIGTSDGADYEISEQGDYSHYYFTNEDVYECATSVSTTGKVYCKLYTNYLGAKIFLVGSKAYKDVPGGEIVRHYIFENDLYTY